MEVDRMRLASHKQIVYLLYTDLCACIKSALSDKRAALDGEIVCSHDHGVSHFNDPLLFVLARLASLSSICSGSTVKIYVRCAV
jgi:hypothetical protein